MTKYNFLMLSALFIATSLMMSCKNDAVVTDNTSNSEISINENVSASEDVANAPKEFRLPEQAVKFLWREDKFDERINRTVSSIVINEDYAKNISDQERAALGYIATYIGSECDWDGNNGYPNDDRSNLKCMIIDALDLGYQCSDQHLGFLRKMFKNDAKVLEKLDDYCPVVPFTASSVNTFTEIALTIKDNQIIVSYSASGANAQTMDSWEWEEINYFEYDENQVQLVKVEEL